ncbi:dihydroxyacetone kinase phosphoryl donor subunit DhaM [Clostridium sp. DL1XJH146]
MVGVVIVSHSKAIAEGTVDMASQMAFDAPIAAAGGTSDGRLGTDSEKIMKAIRNVYSEDGVIVLFDIGSAYMNAEISLELLEEQYQSNVEIVDAALVEGAVSAAVDSSVGKSMEEIKETLKQLKLGKMP